MALVDAQKSLQDEERLYVMVGGLGKDQVRQRFQRTDQQSD